MDNNETTYTLPEGWIWTTIPELFVIIGGGTPAKNNISFWNGDINWASVKDIKSKYLKETIDKISKEGLEYSNTNIANKGDLVLVTRISPGQVAIVKEPTAVNQDLKILKIFGSMPYEYVYYLLCNYKNKFIEHSSGTTVKGLKISDLKNIQLPLPPLPEQHRIVSRIEELFSELDHAEEGLKKAQKQLEVYRQALLKSAFEGKRIIPLGEMVETITKGASPKWQGINYTENPNDVLFITSENIRNNYIDINIKKFVEKKINQIQPRSVLKKGDVLLNIVGASIGRAAYFDLNINANINQAVALIRPLIDYKYLTYFLNSPIAYDYYAKRMVNVARANLSLKDVAEILIPFCSREDQNQIVQELESKFTIIESLEKSISVGIKKIEVFRQSILRKAFKGELTSQILNEEPASSLLKRIRKEKQAYLEKLSHDEKGKPKRKATMEKSNLSVKEVLQNQSEPISAKQIWKQSKFQDDSNIDLFYAELKELEDSIFIELEGKETLIAWKDENQ